MFFFLLLLLGGVGVGAYGFGLPGWALINFLGFQGGRSLKCGKLIKKTMVMVNNHCFFFQWSGFSVSHLSSIYSSKILLCKPGCLFVICCGILSSVLTLNVKLPSLQHLLWLHPGNHHDNSLKCVMFKPVLREQSCLGQQGQKIYHV